MTSPRPILRRPPQTTPEHQLRDIAKSAQPGPPLELVHITTVGFGWEIIKGGKIECRNCSVFNESLVYFFVARPIYRLRDGDTNNSQIASAPIAFVCSPEHIPQPPHQIYPFDTGAAHAGRFHQEIPESEYLDNFELEASMDGASRHIAWAYGSNSSYYAGELKLGLPTTVEEWLTTVHAYLRIAGSSGTAQNSSDKRTEAIEVAYKCHVPLKGVCQLIVFPRQFIEGKNNANNDKLLQFLETSALHWDVYDWQPSEPPNSYLSDIGTIVKQYFSSKGSL